MSSGISSCIHLIAFHAFHEEIWDPQGKEEISCPLLLFACVLLQLQEVKDVCMPRLQVHSKGSRSLNQANRKEIY